MAKAHSPIRTPATQWLQQRGLAFSTRSYHYEHHGGARHAAEALGLDPHAVAKTLVMEDGNAQPLLVIMHGDQEVSTKNLARQTGTKKITPCAPAVAQRHSGYLIGGTSPFGTRKPMPVWVQASLLDMPQIYVNGGQRGLLLGIAPVILIEALGARTVDVALCP